MTKLSTLIRSYGSAADFVGLFQRLPVILIALWLGVISIAMIPQLNIIEGGILFILFFISSLLIDSVFNPNKLKNPKIGRALNAIGTKNYLILIILHLTATIILAIHLALMSSKIQILLIIILGLGLNIINSRYLARMKSSSGISNVTGVLGGVALPMVAAFYIIADNLDLFSFTIIGSISFIYMGLELFHQTKKDIEISPEATKKNSIEWEALSVTTDLGLPKSRAKEVAVQLYNIHNEKDFKPVPPENRILFLPHCLRIAERCKASYNEEGLQCKHCTKYCKVNIITREADKLGYRYFVVPGGAMVFNIVKKYQPKAVVAVACFNELREGTSRTESEYKVPFQVIPLIKDGCVNTEVSIDEVIKALSMVENN